MVCRLQLLWLKAADALRPIGDHNDFQPDNILRVFFISRLKLWSIEASAELLEMWSIFEDPGQLCFVGW
jgi:hypothetical protein